MWSCDLLLFYANKHETLHLIPFILYLYQHPTKEAACIQLIKELIHPGTPHVQFTRLRLCQTVQRIAGKCGVRCRISERSTFFTGMESAQQEAHSFFPQQIVAINFMLISQKIGRGSTLWQCLSTKTLRQSQHSCLLGIFFLFGFYRLNILHQQKPQHTIDHVATGKHHGQVHTLNFNSSTAAAQCTAVTTNSIVKRTFQLKHTQILR